MRHSSLNGQRTCPLPGEHNSLAGGSLLSTQSVLMGGSGMAAGKSFAQSMASLNMVQDYVITIYNKDMEV